MTIALGQQPPGGRVRQIRDSPLERRDVIPQMPKHVSVAKLAQQTTNLPRGVIMVHRKPFTAPGGPSADGADTTLQRVQVVVLAGGDAVGRLDVAAMRGPLAGLEHLAVVRGAPWPRVRCRTA